MAIPPQIIEKTALELNQRAATILPKDVRVGLEKIQRNESNKLTQFVLSCINRNVEIAETDQRPFCADTGLPRYYVKIGNEARIRDGFISLEQALRKATAEATRSIPLRPNRVHPLTRHDPNNNVGIHAPSVSYTFEPESDWIDITVVHKGGLFGSDYRMLFPSDGIPGIKKFFLDTLSQFFRRGLSCQPAIVGIGIGGAKDDCFRLGMEASLLRTVGSKNPDPMIAGLEEELMDIGNASGFGPMGLPGNGSVMDVHIEIAYPHTGGLPVSVHHLCYAARRATARIYKDNNIEFREDPVWFTDYYRRDGIE
jgi:L(+)-tartrate dehydratase alpha subunit